jgi:hypothetical protein
MTKKGKAKLRQLIEFIRELPDEQFDFSRIVKEVDRHECGTVCCAAGWLPKVFPKDWAYTKAWHAGQGAASVALKESEDVGVEDFLKSYFEAPEEDIDRIFFYGYGYLEADSTREAWIENAEEYLLEQNA